MHGWVVRKFGVGGGVDRSPLQSCALQTTSHTGRRPPRHRQPYAHPAAHHIKHSQALTSLRSRGRSSLLGLALRAAAAGPALLPPPASVPLPPQHSCRWLQQCCRRRRRCCCCSIDCCKTCCWGCQCCCHRRGPCRRRCAKVAAATVLAGTGGAACWSVTACLSALPLLCPDQQWTWVMHRTPEQSAASARAAACASRLPAEQPEPAAPLPTCLRQPNSDRTYQA